QRAGATRTAPRPVLDCGNGPAPPASPASSPHPWALICLLRGPRGSLYQHHDSFMNERAGSGLRTFPQRGERRGPMREAVIVDAVRTPLGRGKQTGGLFPVHAVDLAAQPLRALVERTGLDPGEVEDVIMGCVSQVGEQGVNVGRNAALAAGFPESV